MITANSIKNIMELAANEMKTSNMRSGTAFGAILRGIDRINNMRGGLALGFGQYEGMAWKELPESYRTWITEQIRPMCASAELMALIK